MVIKVCTVELENLIRNYAMKGISKALALNKDNCATNWNEVYAVNLSNLLCRDESVVVNTLRQLFAMESSKEALNTEDYEQIKSNNQEGSDYCIRVVHENETLCILSKKEIK